jgi:hypothetical protein
MATPAIVKGTAGLSFGVGSVVGVIMETGDAEVAGVLTKIEDEQNNTVGFSISHFGEADITGGYVWLGADITTLGSAIAVAGTPSFAPLSGGIYVYSYGRRTMNKGFVKGTFKAIQVSGIA